MKPSVIAVALAMIACSSDTVEPVDVVEALRAVEVVTGLEYPVHLTAPAGDDRLFVVELTGRIRVIRDDVLLERPFLDLSARVRGGPEQGLLSLAFDPAYASTGRFWVNYTDAIDGATIVEEYRVSDDPDVADPASARLVLRVPQPNGLHNGGLLMFGPDQMLYIGIGDGADPAAAQDPGDLHGSVLRIDIRGEAPYEIPPDNPFAEGVGGRPEVWAYGLRNPWRFAFDTDAGMLFVTDVGESTWEEINAVPADAAPVNYGWSIMEGLHCYDGTACDRDGLTDPVHEHNHDVGCSVIGGYVYRGTRLPGLEGHFFYGDYCQGWVRSLRIENGVATDHRDWKLGVLGHILSFGQDAAGELYILTTTGSAFRLEPRG